MDFGYKKLYVDGQLIDSSTGMKSSVICPGTEEKVAEVAWASKEDTLKALESAQRGFEKWSHLSLKDRTSWMTKLRDAVIAKQDLIRSSVMYEMGKPWEATEEDYQLLIDALEWYPEEMKHMRDEILADVENTHSHKLVNKPAGVAVAFLAWNFPMLNVAYKIGPALAAGCSLIIRPSNSSPLSALILGEILYDIKFPSGVVNILTGSTEEVALTLSQSTIPRVLTIIGSSETGRKLIAQSATSIKKMSMELGGNAPVMIFEDADLKRAASEVAAIKFGNCGQICVAPNRIFVHKKVFKEFLELFIQKAKNVRVGFGKDEHPTMGPLINESARKRVMNLLEDAIQKGAKLEFGGKIPSDKNKGFFFEPTVLSNVNQSMLVYREEIFGPIAGIIEFEDESNVLKMANETEYGLSSYLYTNDSERIQRFSEEIQFGELHVNGFKYAIDLPHGGVKESGLGHDCSHLALHDYLVKKRITIKR